MAFPSLFYHLPIVREKDGDDPSLGAFRRGAKDGSWGRLNFTNPREQYLSKPIGGVIGRRAWLFAR